MSDTPLPTRDEIEQSQRICEAATEPPWIATDNPDDAFDVCVYGPDENWLANVGNWARANPEADEEACRKQTVELRDLADGAFIAHARTALPRANAALLRFMDLLPYVQHMPGCASFKALRIEGDGWNSKVVEYQPCDCNLSARLAALGLGERGEGGGG